MVCEDGSQKENSRRGSGVTVFSLFDEKRCFRGREGNGIPYASMEAQASGSGPERIVISIALIETVSA